MAVDPIPLFRKETLAQLGDFPFELLTLSPDRIERETSYRWAKQEPVGALPIRQYLGSTIRGNLGPHEDKFTITGVFYPTVSGRIDHLKKLRDLGASGRPQRLIYADTRLGENLGLFTILRIKETRSIFDGDGIPLKIEFTVELEPYYAREAA